LLNTLLYVFKTFHVFRHIFLSCHFIQFVFYVVFPQRIFCLCFALSTKLKLNKNIHRPNLNTQNFNSIALLLRAHRRGAICVYYFFLSMGTDFINKSLRFTAKNKFGFYNSFRLLYWFPLRWFAACHINECEPGSSSAVHEFESYK
jgi:hypothetical protein